ncbi:MAG: hypothetical protein K2K66_03240 [Ruminococcus sp.]|nr:hypothetical protein [Ruminococcus sp.]
MEIYNSMKQELQDFIDRDTTADEEYEFYNYFTNKYFRYEKIESELL